MKKLLVLASLLVAVGCSPAIEKVSVIKGDPGAPGKDGVSCTLSEVEGGVQLSCSDETSFIVYNGTNGSNGQDGEDGQDGQDGENGADGLSCEVEQTESGATIHCANSEAVIANGSAGADGQDGEDGQDGQDAIATISSYSANSCTLIAGSSVYVKKGNNNAGLYTSSNCHSSSKYAEISQGEAYWVASDILATWDGSGVKVINF